MTNPKPANPRPHNRFAYFLFERRLTAREVAPHVGCSHEQVRRIALPFDDADWRMPSPTLKEAIEAYTWGAVTVEDWGEAPNLTGEELAVAA